MDIELRQQLVTRHHEIRNFLRLSSFAEKTDALLAERTREYQKLSAILDRYTGLLPRLEVSRCPFCGESQAIAVDNVNLDGPWWSMDEPARPITPDKLCPHWLTQTGAVSVAGSPPVAPFTIKLGPAVPYVVKPILERPDVRAVLSSFRVGAHRAFLVMYFTPQPDFNVPLHDVWPTRVRPPGPGKASLAAAESIRDYYDEFSYDYDLAPWMASGKLFWIAPDAADCKLYSGPTGSPYLGLPGERRIQRMLNGTLKA